MFSLSSSTGPVKTTKCQPGAGTQEAAGGVGLAGGRAASEGTDSSAGPRAR